jgi:predicted aspartyl protease
MRTPAVRAVFVGFAAAAVLFATGCATVAKQLRPVTIPATHIGDHLYLQLDLGGRRRSMLFDSGATQSFAAIAGCAFSSRTLPVAYRGEGLGSLAFGCADFGPGSFDGYPFDGLLGFDFIRKAPVEVDYDRRAIRVGVAPLGPGGSGTLKITLLEDDSGGRIPIVEMTLVSGHKARTGRFILDTGARGTLAVSRRFAAQAGLDDRQAPEALVGGGGAVVKELRARLLRIESFQLGPYRLDRPIVMVAATDRGIFSVPEFDGVIGGGLLNRFNVTLDYQHSLVRLRPSRKFGSPFAFDQSGMFLIATGSDYTTIVVRDVMPNSPAARAGIKAGAVIERVAGHDVRREGLEWVRWRLQNSGKLTIRFRHGGRADTVTTTLRPLV